MKPPASNEYGVLREVILGPPGSIFRAAGGDQAQWRALGWSAAPDARKAQEEFEAFAALLTSAGARVHMMEGDEGLTLDAIYVRDAAVRGGRGLILASMGKAQRAAEPAALGALAESLGLPVEGAVRGGGRLEGGDVVWFDERTVAVGHGYRTNAEGIRQYAALLGPEVAVTEVPLPHYQGPGHVFHLMSILSPLDQDLALVHSPLMPVPFRNWLLRRGIGFVEAAPSELRTKGCNVLAIAPRVCVMAAGNPVTKARLEAAGCAVHLYPEL